MNSINKSFVHITFLENISFLVYIKSYVRKILIISIIVLFCYSTFAHNSNSNININNSFDSKNVVLITNHNFAPYTINSIKLYLAETYNKDLNISLINVPQDKDFQSLNILINKSNVDIILIDKTYNKNLINTFTDSYKILDYIDLFWVIAINKDKLNKDDYNKILNITKLKDLLDFIIDNRNKYSYNFYPYFDSFSSQLTFLAYYSMLNFNLSPTNINHKFAENSLKEIASFVSNLISINLLNPLSLEANEILAFEVLNAADCILSSLWITEYEYIKFIDNVINTDKTENSVFSILSNSKLIFISFPNQNKLPNKNLINIYLNSKIPTYRFAVIAPETNTSSYNIKKKYVLPDNYKFILNDLKTNVINQSYSKFYEFLFNLAK